MRRAAALFVLATLGVSLSALPAYAQFGLGGIDTSVSISLSPAHPSPGSTVRLTAKSPVLDLSQSTLSWTVNGKVVAQGTGIETADVAVGGLGSETDVSLDVRTPEGARASAAVTIIPTDIDLLFDSNSYVPPFYRGRSLPSSGTFVTVQALPHFRRPGGSEVKASDLTYTWKRNGQVLGALSGAGKSSIVIPAPVLFSTDIISLEAASKDGVLSGGASMSLDASDPQVALYEDHPLYGILYRQALGPSNFIPESEMTFAAIPYFAGVSNPNNTGLEYAWDVNGTRIPVDTRNPSKLTVSASASSKQALIELALTHATNFFLDARGSWSIVFSSGAASSDIFHARAQ